ncbi:hypothetical protein B0H14DRAFT_2621379 [Mycena olivaceomarginata]|nr:hypothetical protein B0H14DRAFT_2621379 [Mycena olivaceomarginata]
MFTTQCLASQQKSRPGIQQQTMEHCGWGPEITGNHMKTPILTFVDRVSGDNLQSYREEVAVAPPSPVKRHRAGQSIPAPILPEPDVDNTTDRYQMGFDLEDFGTDLPPPDPKPTACSKPSDAALARFRGLRDSYLGNLLRRDGSIWPSGAEQCARCNASTIEPNVYRCKSCLGDGLLCSDCMVATHSHHPLHRIESSWDTCRGPAVRSPVQLHDSFTVLHINGIHCVAVDACDCKQRLWAGPPEDQLLRAGWFPATDERPRTCATLEVLDHFLTLTYQAKTTMYDYYSLLEKLTNNIFIHHVLGYGQKERLRGNWRGHGSVRAARVRAAEQYGLICRRVNGCNRYANMDWIIARLLRRAVRYHLVLKLVRFVIPKMHIKGHLIGCQDEFSLDRSPGSGQTCGEGIERPWAHIGGGGTSTQEMGPGSREDTLNGHWGSWNWQKLVGLGEHLRTRLDRANKEYAEQLAAFTQFLDGAGRPDWGLEEMVEDFEADPSKKNPYALPMRGLTEAQVLLQFETEEAARVSGGVYRQSTRSVRRRLWRRGWRLRTNNDIVRVQIQLKKAGTTAQQINIMALQRGLNRSIQRLRNLQATYTPIAIVALGQRQNVPEDEQPENVPLFLPSALSQAQRSLESMAGLAAIEKLRDAQCSTALDRLRNQLHVKSHLLVYKHWQARHQGANTCSRTLVERNESKIWLHSEKYQMAWEAKLRLVGGDPAKVGRQILWKEDIRCIEDVEELVRDAEKENGKRKRSVGISAKTHCEEEVEHVARGGESVRVMSWIWTGAGLTGNDADIEDALRVEWTKAYARVRRSRKQMLVEEEVRRARVTLEFRANKWEDRARGVPVSSAEQEEWREVTPWAVERSEGSIAYALKQAHMYRNIACRITVSMTEERRGRGKRRRLGEATELGEGVEEDIEVWRAEEVADDDFLLGGGADEGLMNQGGLRRRRTPVLPHIAPLSLMPPNSHIRAGRRVAGGASCPPTISPTLPHRMPRTSPHPLRHTDSPRVAPFRRHRPGWVAHPAPGYFARAAPPHGAVGAQAA